MSMFILKAQGAEKMLIGELGFKGDEGIWEEIDENEVPKNSRIKIADLGGCSVKKNGYMRSNTYGITSGRYFKKIAEPLDFEPIEKEKYLLLNKPEIKKDTNKVLNILYETGKDRIYKCSFKSNYNDGYNLEISRILDETEIKVKPHEFEEYEYNFRGRFMFIIKIPFGTLNNEQVDRINNTYNKNGRRTFRLDLFAILQLIHQYNLTVVQDEPPYYTSLFSKEEVNTNGKDTEGIEIHNNKLYEIFTFSEASKMWGISDSTLRKNVKNNIFIKDVDYRKSGGVWLITRVAMERKYGKPKDEYNK